MQSLVVRFRSEPSGTGADASAVKQAAEVAQQFGLVLQPLHPGVSDPELERYYVATGQNDADLEAAQAVLRSLESVDAAYVSPTPSPPV